MKVKIGFNHRENTVSGVICGWSWEKEEIRAMAEKLVEGWCEDGVAVGKSGLFGLRVKVTVNGTARS
ncbi:hypothetical protein [Salmonella enterica]|uniref:hypothetical protein n=1 Tax=Salmonella enterica TaxID=28901 RepID=UPI0003EB091C|nr:hypothetical protein [Salmonella enterica]EBL3415525.1 hypothetical protein [Salmonella enterica subsp. enterica serovar Senftenberg]EBL5841639.1 hypothetical protein [Salmonella enterica subsp. enterica serovar Tennessee]EDC4204192.1 hypothetical protein [Salmonella enterica subsp. enterica serovar Typhimurium]EHL9998609.1 hypothetical protein [Salmonella enterica subsp. enterica serovar Agona]EBQ8769048.1 hypothetical protein [Salmonella enterica]